MSINEIPDFLPAPIVNGNLPRRKTNAAIRGREYLDETEVRALANAAARMGRHGKRDAALIWIAYRHAMRVSELAALRWSQVDLQAMTLFTNRLKGGAAGMHPINPDELRAWRALAALRAVGEEFVFQSELGGALGADCVRKLVKRAGRVAGLPLDVHPHMLRHAAGFELMKRGADLRRIQAYLGHVSLASTERYTALMPDAFDGIWS
jgi:type 1 fimbriae regulatory protein FimE